jgi:hypothetical protein
MAIAHWMRTLPQDGVMKSLAGHTDLMQVPSAANRRLAAQGQGVV